MWEAMKSFQVVFWLRLGAGWIPVWSKYQAALE